MTAAQIQSLVDTTFSEADLDADGACPPSVRSFSNRVLAAGFINFAEYQALAHKHPAMLNQVSLNISGMIASRANSTMNMNLDSDEDEDAKGEGKSEGKE